MTVSDDIWRGFARELVPVTDGYTPVEAWGFLGDGSVGDRARLQAAVDATPYLQFRAGKTYILNEIVSTPAGYGSNKKACILTNQSCLWRGEGAVLKVSDALQASADDDDIAILFQYDAAAFSAAGMIFDENADRQGFGAPFACYGVLDVDVDRVTIRNSNPARIGASATRLCGELHGRVKIINGRGTFAIGGKPGGIQRVRDFSAYIENSRGGVNLECEDVDLRGLTHWMTEASFGQIVGYDIDDDNAEGTDSPVEFVKIADGAKRVNGDLISLESAASAATGRATALSIKQGQDAKRVDRVQIGRINATNTVQALYAEAVSVAMGQIQIGEIQCDGVGVPIDLPLTSASGGSFESVVIGKVQGTVLHPSSANVGTAIRIDSDTGSTANNARAPHIAHFALGGGHLSSVRERTFDVRGAKRFEVAKLVVDAHTGTPSGDYAQTVYNVIEADEIVLDAVTLRGFAATNSILELRPKVSLLMTGCNFTAGGATTAVWIDGSGACLIEGCTFLGHATNGLSFRSMTSGNFDAATAVNDGADTITLTAHPFRHGDRVQYANGGGTSIGGLTTTNYYHVIYVDANTIQLSSTLRGSAIAISPGVGASHTLRKALDVLALNNSHTGTFAANTSNPLVYSASGTRLLA